MSLREVVVVDDSDADLLYTRIVIEAAGVARQVMTFETGQDVLAYLQQPQGHQVDMILLDINMPEMSGFEFLEAYQQLNPAHRASAVVVMLTSSPDPADKARAFSFGCVKDYVVKPMSRDAASRLPQLVAASRS